MLKNAVDSISRRQKKEIEDYYKSWVHKNFQKGIKDVKVLISDNNIVILGFEFLTFVEQSILDNDYSKQVISYTRKKIFSKNFPMLKQNIELIMKREVTLSFVEFNTDINLSCVTIFLKEVAK
ncbi:MAG: Na-translocating system protein MpsC family protein [Anaerovoracaceae bacterium]